MTKVLTIVVMSLLIIGMTGTAFASSWGGNPLSAIEPQTNVNSSTDEKYKVKITLERGSYGWSHSIVCGLELCSNVPQVIAPFQAPQTLGIYLGMNPASDLDFSVDAPFDGKFYIKGFFK